MTWRLSCDILQCPSNMFTDSLETLDCERSCFQGRKHNHTYDRALASKQQHSGTMIWGHHSSEVCYPAQQQERKWNYKGNQFVRVRGTREII